MGKNKIGLYSYLVPGFLFQSIIIGGGYGTGNEIAQYFGIHGMCLGIIGMVVTTLVWSVIAALTFEFCRIFKTYDYNSMSRKLLGKLGVMYEVCYIVLMLICLGVANATAGGIIADFTNSSRWVGVAVLSFGIILLVISKTSTFENVLSFWSYVLYAVYALFMIVCIVKFGPSIKAAFDAGGSEYAGNVTDASGNVISFAIGGKSLLNAIVDGLRYSFYNLGLIAAILYSVRRCETRKHAVLCGFLVGVIGVLPAFLLLIAMGGALPEAVYSATHAGTAVSVIFSKLDMNWLYITFEIVFFGTLIETGSATIKAVADRIDVAASSGSKSSRWRSPVVAVSLTLIGVGISAFGLTDLISKGYGTICWGFLIVYVIPMLTIGNYKIAKALKA